MCDIGYTGGQRTDKENNGKHLQFFYLHIIIKLRARSSGEGG